MSTGQKKKNYKIIVEKAWTTFISSGEKYIFRSHDSNENIATINKNFFDIHTNYGRTKKLFNDSDIIVLPFDCDSVKIFIDVFTSPTKIEIANINDANKIIIYFFICDYLGFDITHLDIEEIITVNDTYSIGLLDLVEGICNIYDINNHVADKIIMFFIQKFMLSYFDSYNSLYDIFKLFHITNENDNIQKYIYDLFEKIVNIKNFTPKYFVNKITRCHTTMHKLYYKNNKYVQNFIDDTNIRYINAPNVRKFMSHMDGIDTTIIKPINKSHLIEGLIFKIDEVINKQKILIMEIMPKIITQMIISAKKNIYNDNIELTIDSGIIINKNKNKNQKPDKNQRAYICDIDGFGLPHYVSIFLTGDFYYTYQIDNIDQFMIKID